MGIVTVGTVGAIASERGAATNFVFVRVGGSHISVSSMRCAEASERAGQHDYRAVHHDSLA